MSERAFVDCDSTELMDADMIVAFHGGRCFRKLVRSDGSKLVLAVTPDVPGDGKIYVIRPPRIEDLAPPRFAWLCSYKRRGNDER